MLFQCELLSDALHTAVRVFVILPGLKRSPKGNCLPSREQNFPMLTLCHGAYDNGSCWIRKTNIERYAEEKGLAVVMPSVANSFYTDARLGEAYFTFVTQELPEQVRAIFPLSDKREENFIAGLSMGGYGAMKAALTYPEHYAAGASMSGVLDIVHRVKESAKEKKPEIDLQGIFLSEGRTLEGTANDLLYLLETADTAKLPRLYACCGTSDVLLPESRAFRDKAAEMGIPLAYEEGPGDHEWDFWDRYIRKILDWMVPGTDSPVNMESR